MKWFLGGINIETRIMKENAVELFEDYYSIDAPQNVVDLNLGNCSYVEIWNCKYRSTCSCGIDDEYILILGDIEIYNQDFIADKYLNKKWNDTNPNILVDLYKLVGLDFLKDLNGEFSFALFDRNKKMAYLVTDHLGTKPLFWLKNEDQLYFSSDIFLLQNFFDINLEKSYFKEFYYANGHLNSDKTPYGNLYRVPSGSYVCIPIDNNNVLKHKYWDLALLKDRIVYNSEEDYVNRFLDLLKSSVGRRLLYNDKDAVMMSGGMDSTSLFAVSKSITNTKITPVCGVFEDLIDCDERYYIEQILDMYNLEPIYVFLDECGMFCDYPDNSYITYEPHVSSLVFKFSEAIIKSVADNGLENIITGYGGDHLLTGTLLNTLDKCRKGKISEVYNDIKSYSLMTNRSFFESIKEYVISPLISSKCLPGIDDNIFISLKEKLQEIPTFNQKELYVQMNCTKASHFQSREIGARYGISIKNPFLDKELIEFVFRIPGDLRLNKKYPKYILRESMQGLLPKEVLGRVTKTEHVSLSYKGIVEKWSEVFPIVKEFRISCLDIVSISKEEWEEELLRFRSGQPVRYDFYLLLAIELWIFDYHRKLKN